MRLDSAIVLSVVWDGANRAVPSRFGAGSGLPSGCRLLIDRAPDEIMFPPVLERRAYRASL